MFPMDRKPVPVAVEYTANGKRVVKTFCTAYVARRFYTAKAKAGANPRVRPAKTPSSAATVPATDAPCPACNGTGLNSHGGLCFPCNLMH